MTDSLPDRALACLQELGAYHHIIIEKATYEELNIVMKHIQQYHEDMLGALVASDGSPD